GDISYDVDLIEEIARLYGYDNIPTTLIEGTTTPGALTRQQFLRRELRRLLSLGGYQEVMGYSFIQPEQSKLFPALSEGKLSVKLAMPMSEERSVLRTSLLPQLLDIALYNTNRRQGDLALFEIGNVFFTEEEVLTRQPSELPVLGLLLSGTRAAAQWNIAAEPVDFFDLKGALETVFAHLGLTDRIVYEGNAPEGYHPGRSASIYLLKDEGRVQIGTMGQLHPELQRQLDLEDTYVSEVLLQPLYEAARKELQYSELHRFPGMERDIAVVVDAEVPAGHLMASIREHGGTLLQNVQVFDVYTGGKMEAGKKSVALSLLYRHTDHTLTDEEVVELRIRTHTKEGTTVAMDRTRVAVEIYGTSYKLVGSSTEYMKQVARYVDEHMQAISKSHSRLDTPRIAVLAAVHMAEQAIQVQDFKNELNMLTGERTELRVEVSRLQEVQRERQEEYERLEAAAKEEAARLIAAVEEERSRHLELQEQERQVHAQLLEEEKQAAASAREQLAEELRAREAELKALRENYEAEQVASREAARQELEAAEALRLQQLEELKAAHVQELEQLRETLTREKAETLSGLEQELAQTRESMGSEIVEIRSALSKELADTKAALTSELSGEREALEKELAKNKELRQSQGTQEHRHKQQLQELEKQLGELRGGTGQLQSRLRAAEAGLKGERDARLTLLAQYEAVLKREEQLGEELRLAAEQGQQHSAELEELRQRYEESVSNAAELRSALQETADKLSAALEELHTATELGSLLSDELEGLRKRYELTQEEAAGLRKTLRDVADNLSRTQAEFD
ncbi:hypothetical protein KC345_g11072, partial [Hortaea werneckii]